MSKNPKNQRNRPVRLTLVEQAAECLREGLREGRWDKKLPSESELCKDFGVSRGTLRSSLAVLFQEGLLLPGGRGERHSIPPGASRKRRSASQRAGGFVHILSPQPRFILGGQTQLVFQTASEVLGRAGLHLEFNYHPGLWKLKSPDLRLRKITAQPDAVGWLLYRSTRVVQEWFAKSAIPAAVLGSMYEGISLPHAEFDLIAASRHAAGIFAARGRRRLVYLTVENATAGDIACGEVFQEAAKACGIEASVAVYDDTVEGLCRVIDGLLVERPVPDGYFVGFPNHAPATIGHLNRRNFPVPGEAAVISRMDSRLLCESIPSIARYEMDCEHLGQCLARLLLHSIDTQQKNPPKSHILMPEFVDGESAGAKPSTG